MQHIFCDNMLNIMKRYFNEINFKKIVDSGQCFRAQTLSCGANRDNINETFRFISQDKILDIKQGEEISDPFWCNYFDFDKDYGIDFQGDFAKNDFINQVAEYSKGIRILKQDPFETLISFIISQRRSIPAIKTCVERICKRCGVEKQGMYLFPTPEDLVNADISDCGLGYRHDYVKNAAKLVAYGDINLEAFRKLSTQDLMYELTSIRGVGEKVANCVALFAYSRYECAPIDTWMKRAINTYFGGKNPFVGENAGIAQQYVFYYMINHKNI